MKSAVVITALALSACAIAPQDMNVIGLCHQAMGNRQDAYLAHQELYNRRIDPQACPSIVYAQQQQTLQAIGLGSGLMLQAQPPQPVNCTTIWHSGFSQTQCR
jgi:hypothetical protein